MTSTPLPRSTWLVIAGDAVSSLGTGLVLPLSLIYLHQVRGIALPVVGILLTASGAVGVVAVPLSGMAIDRFGARSVLVWMLIMQAAGYAGAAWAHSALTAAPALLLLGAATGPLFPAMSTLLAGINPDPAAQQRAFALNFTGINASIGVGTAVGAAVADVRSAASFQALFLGAALSRLVFAVVLARLPNVRPDHQPGAAKASYREVLADPALRKVVIAALVLAFTGYAAMDSGLPAYATVEAGLSVHVVALSLTVNTVLIVVAQLFVLRLVRALRRSRALAAIGLIWAVAWAVFGLSAAPLPAAARIGCVMAFTALFGLGETFMAPTVSPLVNTLAEERVRGRANALSSAVYSVAFTLSPAICTGLIAGGLAALWIVLLCAGCLVTVAMGLSLGRRLSHAQDRVADPSAVGAGVTV